MITYSILSFIIVVEATLIPLKQDGSAVRRSEARTEIICAKRFIKARIRCKDVLIWLGSTENVDSLIKEVSKDVCNNMKVRNFDAISIRARAKQQTYIITVRHVDEFVYGMQNVTDDASWNPVAKFIIRVEDPVTVAQMRRLFYTLMQYKMYHVAFITSVFGETGIYTYYPFQDNGCGRKFSNIVKISDCTSENISNIRIFTIPEKPLRDCSIYIIANEDVPNVIVNSSYSRSSGRKMLGIEQYFMQTVAKLESLKLFYTYAIPGTYGVVLANGSTTGLLYSLRNGSADVAMGGFLLMENRASMFDYVWGFNFAVFNLFYASRDVQRWQHFYKEFSREVWAMILLVFLGVSITLFYITRVPLGSEKRYELPSFMLTLWGYFFSNTSSKLSSDKQIRLFVLSWIFFAYFVSSFYSTALYSLITGRPRDDYVDIDILKSESMRPCISNATYAFFNYSYNQTLPTNEVHRPECEEAVTCLRTVARRGDSYSIETDYTYTLRECEFIDDEGREMLKQLQFAPYVITVIYFNKGFPLRNRFHEVAMKLLESGLIAKQLDDISLESHLRCQRKTLVVFRKFMLGELRVPFLILFGGTALSLLVFVLEIHYGRKIKH